VPAGKTLLVNMGTVRLTNAGAGSNIASAHITFKMRPYGGVYNTLVSPEISTSAPYSFSNENFILFLERTDIKMKVESVTNDNSIVTSIIGGVLVNN
jgi:hypothetical protein